MSLEISDTLLAHLIILGETLNHAEAARSCTCEAMPPNAAAGTTDHPDSSPLHRDAQAG